MSFQIQLHHLLTHYTFGHGKSIDMHACPQLLHGKQDTMTPDLCMLRCPLNDKLKKSCRIQIASIKINVRFRNLGLFVGYC